MTNFPPGADIYPLLLEAVPRERIWGGRMLASLMHKSLPAETPIGETWEAWPGCRILQGKHAGQTLEALLATHGQAIAGAAAARGGTFPLLFKYLDARDHLSVQVHPDDALAHALEAEELGKTEAWYVLQAEPGVALIHGFRRDTSAAEVAAALGTGALGGSLPHGATSDDTGDAAQGAQPGSDAAQTTRAPSLADLLQFVTVEAGDVVFLPAGTVHALGKGMVIAEIQQNSDLTYRLYDWDRRDAAGKPRELHIEKGLRAAEYDALREHKVQGVSLSQPYGERRFLLACRYFAWERLVVRQAAEAQPLRDTFHLLAVLNGGAAIRFGPAGEWAVEAHAGQTVLVPAALAQYGITPLDGECTLLRMYVPNLRADVVETLRSAGIADERIAPLGGSETAHNDLLPLLSAAAR